MLQESSTVRLAESLNITLLTDSPTKAGEVACTEVQPLSTNYRQWHRDLLRSGCMRWPSGLATAGTPWVPAGGVGGDRGGAREGLVGPFVSGGRHRLAMAVCLVSYACVRYLRAGPFAKIFLCEDTVGLSRSSK